MKKVTFLLFVCVLMLLSGEVWSQKQDTILARQLLETAKAERDSAHYDEMIALAEQAGAIYKEVLGAESLAYANALHQKAIALRIQGKSEKAYQFWEKAYEIRANQLGDDSENMGWSYITLSRLLAGQSKYDTALVVVEKAIKIAEKVANNYQLADALLAKTYILDSQGNPKEAVLLQQKAIALLEKHHPDKHLRIAYATATLGITHNLINRQISDKYILKALASYRQQVGENNFWTGYCLFFLGVNKQEDYEIGAAVAYFKQAKEVFKETLPTNHIMNTQNSLNLALMLYHQGKKMEAIKVFEQIANDLKTSDTGDKSSIGNIYQNLGAIYNEVGNLLKGQNYFEKHLSLLEETNESYLKIVTAKNNLVVAYLNTNQSEKARKLLEEIEVNLEKCEEMQICQEKRNFFYQNKAGFYERIGNQEKAIEYNYKFLLVSEKLKDLNWTITAYTQLAHNYSFREDFATALNYLKKAEHLNQKLAKKNNYILGDLGRIYLNLGEYEQAEQYLKRSLELVQKENPNNNRIATYHTNLGVLYADTKRYQAAENSYKKAIEKNIEIYGDKTPKIIGGYINLAHLYIKQQDWSRAKEMLQKAETLLFPESKTERWAGLQEHLLKSYFGIRHKLYTGLYSEDKDISYLDAIIENSQQAHSYENYYAKSLNTDYAKGKIHERIYPYYLYAIEAYHKKIIANPSQAKIYKKKIYELSEQGSQKLLRAKVLNADIEKYADLPVEITQQKTDLEQNILLLEKKVELGQGQDWMKQATLQQLRQSLANERIQYAHFMDTIIRKEYPDYYNLKRNNEITSLETLQANLSTAEVLLKYIIADTTIFLLAITPTQFEVKAVPKDSNLLKHLNTLPEVLAEHTLENEREVELMTKYQASATYVYQSLIAPIQHLLAEKLIIIPDGILYHLPFESLLVTTPKPKSYYSDWHYLLNDQQISYDFSATLYQEQQNKTASQASHKLLAIAPTFEKQDTLAYPPAIALRQGRTSTTLDPLKFNIPEATAIHNLFGGHFLKNSKATLSNFLAAVSDYKIIHFATHAAANDENGDYSRIYFSKSDSLNGQILYAKDMYGFNLDADMVVFSACETGDGELKNGAGIISLARGIIYAGAKSVVASAWKVEDNRTKDLMLAFYANLKKGLSKSAALQQAKLTIIKNHNPSPRYWAAFMAYGNMEAIHLDNNLSSWWLYALLPLVGIGLFFLIKKRKNS